MIRFTVLKLGTVKGEKETTLFNEECVAMIKAELAKEPMGDIGGENNPKGLNQHSNEIGQVDTVNLTKEPKGGNNKSYLLRRLAKESKAGN